MCRGPRHSPVGDAGFLLVHITLGRDSSGGGEHLVTQTATYREKGCPGPLVSLRTGS